MLSLQLQFSRVFLCSSSIFILDHLSLLFSPRFLLFIHLYSSTSLFTLQPSLFTLSPSPASSRTAWVIFLVVVIVRGFYFYLFPVNIEHTTCWHISYKPHPSNIRVHVYPQQTKRQGETPPPVYIYIKRTTKIKCSMYIFKDMNFNWRDA